MAFLLKNVSLPASFEGSETPCSFADSVKDNGNKTVSKERSLFNFFFWRPPMELPCVKSKGKIQESFLTLL